MTRKLFGRALGLVVLTAGLVVLATQVSATQTGPSADEPTPTQSAAANPTADGAVDMGTWQRTGGQPSGSKYKPPPR